MSTHIVTVGLYSNIDKLPGFAQSLDLKYLFCPAEHLCRVIELQRAGEISLEIVVVMDNIGTEAAQACITAKIRLISFEELTLGEPRGEPETIDTGEPYCLSLTSGTTGPAKFCIISHQNLMANLSSVLYLSSEVATEESYLSYINFSSLGEKVFVLMVTASGGKIGIARNAVDFKKDMKYLQPTVLLTVPRMLEFVYNSIKNSVDSLTGISRSLFAKGYKAKRKQYERTGSFRHVLWDALVFKKVKKVMGGNLKYLVVGAAMCNAEVVKYLRIVLGCHILEGYNIVEGTACSLCTLPLDPNCGYVGGPLINLEVRLRYTGISIEEHNGYCGELLMKGQSISGRYYGAEGAAVDSEGWLHTGDMCALIPETGAFRFVDRIEYLGKARSGKCVCVQKLEIVYRQCPFVAQILVVADQRIEGIVAVVVPDRAVVSGRWKEKDVRSVYVSREFMEILIREFAGLERTFKLKEHEKILRVFVESEPWAGDELITPTLKVRRNKIIEKYQLEIEGMVSEILVTGNGIGSEL